MARYGNRKSKGSKDSEERSSGRSGRRSSKRNNKKGNDNILNLGSITKVKSKEDDDDYQELTDDLVDSEAGYNFKVYLGDKDEVTLKKGDNVYIKFKEYDKSPDYVVGKVFLMLDDD